MDDCDCKKPKAGLIKQAITDYPEIDMSKSIMIGDSDCDVGLAREFDIPVYKIKTDMDEKVRYNKEIQVNSLYEAACIIKKNL